jgi:hypothetical protein
MGRYGMGRYGMGRYDLILALGYLFTIGYVIASPFAGIFPLFDENMHANITPPLPCTTVTHSFSNITRTLETCTTSTLISNKNRLSGYNGILNTGLFGNVEGFTIEFATYPFDATYLVTDVYDTPFSIANKIGVYLLINMDSLYSVDITLSFTDINDEVAQLRFTFNDPFFVQNVFNNMVLLFENFQYDDIFRWTDITKVSLYQEHQSGLDGYMIFLTPTNTPANKLLASRVVTTTNNIVSHHIVDGLSNTYWLPEAIIVFLGKATIHFH